MPNTEIPAWSKNRNQYNPELKQAQSNPRNEPQALVEAWAPILGPHLGWFLGP
jgi:hypothetical protein